MSATLTSTEPPPNLTAFITAMSVPLFQVNAPESRGREQDGGERA
jgi:hypothetical protein